MPESCEPDTPALWCLVASVFLPQCRSKSSQFASPARRAMFSHFRRKCNSPPQIHFGKSSCCGRLSGQKYLHARHENCWKRYFAAFWAGMRICQRVPAAASGSQEVVKIIETAKRTVQVRSKLFIYSSLQNFGAEEGTRTFGS